jgi:hypothetical protein
MSTKFEEFDPFKVITEEEGSETNLLAAAIAVLHQV